MITVCLPREVAKERGIKRYMTGEACKEGHYCSKWVADTRCCECERLRNIKRYHADPEFHKKRSREYRKLPSTKERNATTLRERRKKNPELFAKYNKTKYEKIKSDPVKLVKERARQLTKQQKAYWKNPEKYRMLVKERRKNPERKRVENERSLQWKADNPDKVRALNRKHSPLRRAAKIHRTPKWLTEQDIETMTHLYEVASILGMHVDHIIPLRGKLVSGLHVPSNLQLLTPEANHVKYNNYEVE